jgi:hypothetical protein
MMDFLVRHLFACYILFYFILICHSFCALTVLEIALMTCCMIERLEIGGHWACYGLGWDVYRCRKSNPWASDWAEITRKTPKCLAGGDSVGVTLAPNYVKRQKLEVGVGYPSG